MPRPVRLSLPDIPQHITRRGNNRQACFFSVDDYRLYLDLLHEACRDLFKRKLKQSNIDSIRQCVDTGLPTGNGRFRQKIEEALCIKLGHGKRGRPRKTQK